MSSFSPSEIANSFKLSMGIFTLSFPESPNELNSNRSSVHKIFRSEQQKATLIRKARANSEFNMKREFLRCLEIIEPFIEGNPRHEEFRSLDIPIEIAIDRVQCLLWVIIKNKGLPEGCVMDKRISKTAHEPIILGETFTFSEAINGNPHHAVTQLGHMIERVLLDNAELTESELTFGVY
jgi:hypothetical protein